MIRNIVFDLGNVLIDYNPRRIVNAVFKEETDQKLFFNEIFLTKAWKKLDQGVISFDDHYKNLVTLYPQYKEEIGWILDNWLKDMPLIPGMYKVVETISKAGYDLYILSNASMRYYTYALSKLDIFKFFKGITISAELKLIKPQKEIFDRFCQIHNLSPEECLFFDDQLDNVQAANKSGWQAQQFTSTKNLKEYLQEIIGITFPLIS